MQNGRWVARSDGAHVKVLFRHLRIDQEVGKISRVTTVEMLFRQGLGDD